MLAPQFVTAMLYFLALRHLEPVKFVMDQNAGVSSMISYNVMPEINWILITTGISLLILAWIFRDGLETKEDTTLIL